MTKKAQRDYYRMAAAGDVLVPRIEALSDTIPAGSVVLDIGCNDGSISSALLDRGVISKSYCFDLENILAGQRPEIVFQQANLVHHDLNTLPDADGVLLLNVLHHVIAASKDRAKEVIDYLLNRYSFVIIDLGSFTERGDWHWRRAYDKNWKSDGEMWDFLFSNAKLRFKLLNYPTQGKGHRTLWKLYSQPYELNDLEVLDTFKRVPEAWAPDKQLIKIADIGETKVVNTVEFSVVRSKRGDKFFTKRYRGPSRAIRAKLEYELAAHAVREAAYVSSITPVRLRAVAPLAVEPEGKLIFAFEPDAFGALIVHFQDWFEFFPQEECKAAGVFGTRRIEVTPELPRLMLINACDFQICTCWDGLAALDFEPNNWLVRLFANNVLGGQGAESTPAPTKPVPYGEALQKMSAVDDALEKLRAEIRGLRRELRTRTTDQSPPYPASKG